MSISVVWCPLIECLLPLRRVRTGKGVNSKSMHDVEKLSSAWEQYRTQWNWFLKHANLMVMCSLFFKLFVGYMLLGGILKFEGWSREHPKTRLLVRKAVFLCLQEQWPVRSARWHSLIAGSQGTHFVKQQVGTFCSLEHVQKCKIPCGATVASA